MGLFQGSKRGHGYGDPSKGTKFIQEKNKWEYDRDKHALGWKWREAGEAEFEAHLEGRMALGTGPLLDDGTTERGELDLDKDSGAAYEFDYAEVMRRLKESGLPFVATRTKSGGIRATINFKEPVEAELVRRGMQILAARMGYSGNEIFPKQDKLVDPNDAPSWTILPYGPTCGVFAEQCGMDDNGNPIALEEYVKLAESRRISRDEFVRLVGEDDRIKTEARNTGRKKGRKGLWVQEESIEDTVRAMFCDGPPCLWTIAHNRSRDYQHNFLVNMVIFLKRKYPDNWETALEWVNVTLLTPSGSTERLAALKKDMRNREYEYRCKDEPICNHCNPYACRKMTFGVGSGSSSAQHRELGMTIVNRIPAIYYINVGSTRLTFTGPELMNVVAYRGKCLEHMIDFPDKMKQGDWDIIIRADRKCGYCGATRYYENQYC
jgi:hypothetical protein